MAASKWIAKRGEAPRLQLYSNFFILTFFQPASPVKQKVDIDYLRKNNLIVFECISGSRAYGTHLPHSDTDIKGIFILPKEDFYGLDYVEQVNNETNDIVFYELKRFFDLLYKNNPNILELLSTPEDCMLYRHPLLAQIQPEIFLSKLCNPTFAGYAVAQIKKAKGLNKKIMKPMDERRKSVLDFCYVVKGQGSVSLQQWLEEHAFTQTHCGLAKIPHLLDVYGLYYDHDKTIGYKGIMPKDTANEVSLSSIPKGVQPDAIMSFNKNGYSTYCREYTEYWDWVGKRNEERYENTISHGKNYDAKNMMHVFRLLDMAEEIARANTIVTRRPNREFLLRIRSGEFLYEDLVVQAEEKIERINAYFASSSLPETPNKEQIEALLVTIRKAYYEEAEG